MSGEGTYRFPLLESLIKPTLHDPASFEHVSLTCKFKKGKKKTDLDEKATTSTEPSFQGTLIEDVKRHQVENPQ